MLTDGCRRRLLPVATVSAQSAVSDPGEGRCLVDNNEIFITKILFNFLLSRPPPTPPPPQHPANQLLEGRSGISHGVLLPGISGLSFPFFNFFLSPCRFSARSSCSFCLVIFLLMMVHISCPFPPKKFLEHFSLKIIVVFIVVKQLGGHSW